MKTIKIRLNTQSLSQARKELEEYKKELQRKIKYVLYVFASEGLEICQSEILSLDIYDTGHLLSCADAVIDEANNKAVIKVDCNYAVYVEFGTGTVGASSGYIGSAMAKIGYRYGAGEHHVITADGRDGWYYPTKDGGYRFTEGYYSRPFMYNTAEELKRRAKDLIESVMK